MYKNQFCPECEITMDLHDDPNDCEWAILQANRISQIERMMFGGFLR